MALKISSKTKIYILCQANFATGGHEALMIAVSYLHHFSIGSFMLNIIGKSSKIIQ
jgi:hypothetical protein